MAKCGSAFFPKNRSPRSRWKPEWAKAKDLWSPGSLLFGPPMFCLKWTVSPKPSLANPCASPRPNSRSRRGSSPAATSMKKSQRKEVQEKTLPELLADGRNIRQELFNLRLQQASAQLEKPARLRTLRRDIARIETRVSQLRHKAAAKA